MQQQLDDYRKQKIKMKDINYKKLHLGCGEIKKEGYVNVDWKDSTNPDVVYDLNKLPYSFGSNTFEVIEAIHVLEHLDKPFEVMRELHRILKPEGKLLIKVPHFSRGFSHAEHAHGFDITFPLYFNSDFNKSSFIGFEFKNKVMRLRWMAFFHLMPHLGYGKSTIFIFRIINKIISFFANLSPGFCSRIWCFWVGGFEEIEFNFVCKK